MRIVRKVVRLVTDSEAGALAGRDVAAEKYDACRVDSLAAALKTLGLTDFEICNVINVRPRSLACLQTIIDEMAERLSEDQMNGILEMLR